MVFSRRLLHSFVHNRSNVYCFPTVCLATIAYGSYLGQPRSNVMLLIDSPWVFWYATRPSDKSFLRSKSYVTFLLHITIGTRCLFLFTRFHPTDLYKYSPDVVPPIHAVSYHVATDKLPSQNGDKFRSIFSYNLQPIATRGKKEHGTLLVD